MKISKHEHVEICMVSLVATVRIAQGLLLLVMAHFSRHNQARKSLIGHYYDGQVWSTPGYTNCLEQREPRLVISGAIRAS